MLTHASFIPIEGHGWLQWYQIQSFLGILPVRRRIPPQQVRSVDPVPPPRILPIPAPTPRRRLPIAAGLRISAVSRSGAADHLDFSRRLGLVGIQRVIVEISRFSDYLFVVFGFCDSVDPRLANEVGSVESALRHLVARIVPRNSPSRCFDLRWIHHVASKAICSDSVHP